MFLKNVLTQSLKLLNCSRSYLKISSVSKPASSVHFDLKLFSSTVQRHDLMEFFDDKNNLTEDKIKHGRAWRIDELRLKSNLDLHKLWYTLSIFNLFIMFLDVYFGKSRYVLHKERNMLLTMEEAFKKQVEPFPSPERITKV
jgi:large subunit ribosomal protein L47